MQLDILAFFLLARMNNTAHILETDCITTGYIAEQIGKLLDVPVLPTIPFGRSVIHRDFPGTIYITDETYEHYLRDVFSAIQENAI